MPGPAARPGRAHRRRAAARGRARRRAASGCASCRPSRRSCSMDALGDLVERAAGTGRGARRALAARARGSRARSSAASSPASSTASSGPSRTRSSWAPVDVSSRAARPALGRRPDRDPRLGDAHDRRGRAFRAQAARARARARAVVGSPYDFPEQALLYVPRTMPDPRGEGFTARAADEIVSLLALSRRARARAHVELPRARGLSRARARSRPVRGARPGRGAARAAARALPRRGRTRCCSQPRRSGRASTSPASRCRCS